MAAEPGDLLLFVADKFEVTCKALYGIRKRFGEELKLYDPKTMHFSWVVEFPMFAFDAEEGLGRRCTIRSRPAARKTSNCSRPIPAAAAPRLTTW